MNFFKSSIIAVTLSSLMLLKVEATDVPLNIPSGTYKVDEEFWIRGDRRQTPSGHQQWVAHPTAESVSLDLVYNAKLVAWHIKNNSGATIKYKVHDLNSGRWTEDIESEHNKMHTVETRNPEFWFAKH